MAIVMEASSALFQTDGPGGTYQSHPLPGTPATNDVVFIFVACDDSLKNAGINPSYGYTYVWFPDIFDPALYIAYKRMGATPDTDVELEYQTSFYQSIIIAVFSGVDTSVALDMAFQDDLGTSGMPNAPAATTATDGALRVIAGFLDDDDTASTVGAPAGYGDLVASDTGQGLTADGCTVMIATKAAPTVGADDPAAFTGDGDDRWRSAHLALRPATEVAASAWADMANIGNGFSHA